MDGKRVNKGPRGMGDDEEENVIPFQGLDKGLVLQEKRIFGDPKVKSRKCCLLITKILYLLVQGERFTKKEATDVFFSVTNLFQSKDLQLRRMVYLVLKDLAPLAEPDNVIIVIAPLTKDMNSQVHTYRANSIRVLCRITEAGMLAQVERYLKQCLVDREAYVASAALVAGLHLIRVGPDIVKRWVNEVQQALSTRNTMVQYHALGLLYQIKKHDRLAVSKLVMSMTKGHLRSPYAHCMLIRFAAQVMATDGHGENRAFFEYIESCLRHKSEIVIYEAARAICSLPEVTSRELTPAITVLQLFLSSPKATLRFAAARTLNRVAQTHPLSVTTCNLDMENLITDVNRSIATLAITTLLKTGSASSVDRLMKQISTFMSDITDEFKVVVIDAIRTLALKFPEKHRALMSFLSGVLREEGGFQFKKAIVEAILDIIKNIPESKEAGLTHLCEFIEDCEFAYLSTKILNLLGNEAPSTSAPSKFIRYIYNRVSLESAAVRAASVSALAKFGVAVDDLRPSVTVLLQRCLFDEDDEVRDRATYYLKVLSEVDRDAAKRLVSGGGLGVPLVNLERALTDYVYGKAVVDPDDPDAPPKRSRPNHSEPFQLSSVPMTVTDRAPPIARREAASGLLAATRGEGAGGAGGAGGGGRSAASLEAAKERLAAVPQFFSYGELFTTSARAQQLTEAETEYVVTCVKHTFAKHVVFQYTVTNTLTDQLLENVTVRMDPASDEGRLKLHAEVPLESLPYGDPGTCYTAFEIVEDESGDASAAALASADTFETTLRFTAKDVDPTTGVADDEGFEDEYQLEEVTLSVSDFVRPTFVSDFGAAWEGAGEDGEAVETYALAGADSLEAAVRLVTKCLGMAPAERSDSVPERKRKHILYLSGLVAGNEAALCRVRMRAPKSAEEGEGISIEVTVRSPSLATSEALVRAVA